VIVPVGAISKLTEHALQAALSLGGEVIAVSVHPEAGQGAAFRADWDRWNPGVRLDTLDSPHWSLVHPIVGYVRPDPGGQFRRATGGADMSQALHAFSLGPCHVPARCESAGPAGSTA
jgi:hypothetical protein